MLFGSMLKGPVITTQHSRAHKDLAQKGATLEVCVGGLTLAVLSRAVSVCLGVLGFYWSAVLLGCGMRTWNTDIFLLHTLLPTG